MLGGSASLTLGITASTGIAAVNIGGTTLHSWAGIGLGQETANNLAGKFLGQEKFAKVLERWREVQTLVIDESMLDSISQQPYVRSSCVDSFHGWRCSVWQTGMLYDHLTQRGLIGQKHLSVVGIYRPSAKAKWPSLWRYTGKPRSLVLGISLKVFSWYCPATFVNFHLSQTGIQRWGPRSRLIQKLGTDVLGHLLLLRESFGKRTKVRPFSIECLPQD